MIINSNELDKVKYPEQFIWKVYAVYAKMHYTGTATIAANNAEECNAAIRQFIGRDPDNEQDSKGYSYVHERDATGQLSDQPGWISKDIYYYG